MSNRKKLAFFEIEAWEKDWLTKHLGGFELRFYDKPLGEETLVAERDFLVLSIGASSMISRRVLEAFPRCEFIAARSRRTSHIDMDACRDRRVMVSRLPSYASHAAAEFTFALMLALSRKVCDAARRGAAGQAGHDGLRGLDLFGKTIGVVGTGHVGMQVIRIAKGFGMRVLAWSAKPNDQMAQELGFTYVNEDVLFRTSDVITLHLPHVPPDRPHATEGIIGKDMITSMKRGALFINTAHPDLVDSDALVWAMREGRLGGLAIDGELSESARTALAMHPNVLVTSRVAYNTQDALEDVLEATAENIKAYFRGFPQHMAGSTI
ncbi:MAG: NAD(P)-dependent oxidoreductase [bacterium]|nr:NAD(P)-dependent oxidoreductase [bacterium]